MVSRKNILVISSCTKSKSVSSKDQPRCDSLQNSHGRNAALSKFSSKLTSAIDLYTGPQAKAIRRALSILRRDYTVDHFIISAGFGFVHESEKLPPYECSFSGKGKRKIREMAKNLNINTAITSKVMNTYDMVYLALGKDYLESIPNLEFWNFN